jgi:uncharacterized membrane protein
MSFLDTSEKNIGKKDVAIRAIVGILLIIISLTHHSVVTAIIGLALVATAYLRHDPIYKATKINTIEKGAPAGK